MDCKHSVKNRVVAGLIAFCMMLSMIPMESGYFYAETAISGINAQLTSSGALETEAKFCTIKGVHEHEIVYAFEEVANESTSEEGTENTESAVYIKWTATCSVCNSESDAEGSLDSENISNACTFKKEGTIKISGYVGAYDGTGHKAFIIEGLEECPSSISVKYKKTEAAPENTAADSYIPYDDANGGTLPKITNAADSAEYTIWFSDGIDDVGDIEVEVSATITKKPLFVFVKDIFLAVGADITNLEGSLEAAINEEDIVETDKLESLQNFQLPEVEFISGDNEGNNIADTTKEGVWEFEVAYSSEKANATDNYEFTYAENPKVTITVSYDEVGDSDYIILGASRVEAETWLKESVTIKPSDENTHIAAVFSENTEWKSASEGIVLTDGIHQDFVFYLKKPDGTIAKKELPYKMDTTVPILSVSAMTEGQTEVLSDEWSKEAFTISLSDTAQNIGTATFWYRISSQDEAWKQITESEGGIYEIPITEDGIVSYEFKATSAAGLDSESMEFIAKKDSVKPGGSIQISGNTWKEFLNTITFGIFFKETQEVAITADEDATSGIAKTEYYISNEVFTEEQLKEEERKENSVIKWEPWTESTNESIKPNNEYVVYAKITDNAGWVTYLSSDAMTIDQEIPIIEITGAYKTDGITEYEEWANEQAVIKGTFSDNLSGVENVYFKKENDTTWTEVQEVDFEEKTYAFTIEAQNYEGNYRVYCVDKSGNKSEEASIGIKMDVAAPGINIITLEPEGWTNEDVGVTVAVSDDVRDNVSSGVTAIFYRKAKADKENAQKIEKNQETGEFTFIIPKEDYNGNYIIYCMDAAGNESAEAEKWIAMDTTAPIVHSVLATPAEWTDKAVTITANVSDEENGSQIAKVFCYRADKEKATASEMTVNADGTYESMIDEQSYSGEYVVYCEDNAGNPSEEKKVGVMMDSEMPAIVVQGAKNVENIQEITDVAYLQDNEVILNITAGISGVKEVKAGYSETPIKDISNISSWNIIEPTEEGVYSYTVNANGTYCFSVTNHAGVEVRTELYTYANIDTTKPELSVIATTGKDNTVISSDTWNREEFVITLSNNAENLGTTTFWYRISEKDKDGADWTPITVSQAGTYEIPITEDGITNYEFKATSAAGLDSETIGFIAKKDSVKPAGSIKISDNEWRAFLNTITFGLFFHETQEAVITPDTDVTSGVIKMEYHISDKALTEAELGASETDWREWTEKEKEAKKISVPLNPNEKYVVYARITDEAGWVTYLSTDGVIADSVSPITEGKAYLTDGTAHTDWTNGRVVIKGTFSDNLSGVEKAYFKKENDTTWTEVEEVDFDEHMYSFTIEPQNYEGNYEVYCVDKAGNPAEDKIAENKISIGVKMDTNMPSVDKITLNPTGWTKEDVSVTVDVSDPAKEGVSSGVTAIFYRKAGIEKKDASKVEKNGEGIFTFVIPKEDYNDTYIFYCVDAAGNESAETEKRITMDITPPTVHSISTAPASWTDKTITITADVSDEANGSQIAKVFCYRADKGKSAASELTLNAEGKYEIVIPPQSYQGEYVVFCTDNAGNESAKKAITVYMDITAPVVDTAAADVAIWTKGKVVIHGKVSDTLSGTAMVYCNKVGNKDSSLVKSIVPNADGSYSFTIEEQSYEGNYEIYCVDNVGRNSSKSFVGVKMDNQSPKVESVKASKTGWTKEAITISGTISDNLSQVAEVWYQKTNSGNKWEKAELNVKENSYTFAVPDQDYQGSYSVYCVDTAKNPSKSIDITVQMDITPPKINAAPDMSAWTDKEVVISGTYSDNLSGVKEIYCRKGTNGAEIPVAFADSTYAFTIDAQDYEGSYYIYCYDTAGVKSEEQEVSVKMDVSEPNINSANVYLADGTTSHTYWTNDKVIVRGKVSDNLSGVTEVWYKKTGSEEAWKPAYLEENNYAFTIEKQDYEGSYSIYCADTVGRKSDETTINVQMDITRPEEPTVTYSEPLLEKILEAITFGYYRSSVDVTFTVTDNLAGITSFAWVYVKESGTSNSILPEKSGAIEEPDITYSPDGKTASATIRLSASEAEQFRGNISVSVKDRATNTNTTNEGRIIVVDNIAPNRTVRYTPANQVADKATLQSKTNYNYSSEGANVILYYADSVTATFKITEANFYEEDVVIKVNGTQVKPQKWEQNGDEWTAEIVLSEEGDYIVTMDYTDRSQNQMQSYTSEKIVIDRTAPTIDVKYANQSVRKTVGNRAYYDDVQTATLIIKEHNFRPDDVKVLITAEDLLGTDIMTVDENGYVTSYQAAGVNRSNWSAYENSTWRRVDDTYQLVIGYQADANYTFDVMYEDLAKNAAADFAADAFTVDRTPPKNLQVEYSTNIFEQILEAITFGYYNAQMTVTISAEDNISGISEFHYSMKKEAGASTINAELLDEAIANANITQNGNVFTASFEIPGNGQTSGQFNGTIEFTATDGSMNNTDMADDENIIVDNISPTAEISYSDPIREDGNIAYYNGDVQATIVIDEANFHAEDVEVSVTRDDGQYSANVSWLDNSADVHTGTFVLSEDGDYFVTVNYTDRSLNEMETYTSNQLTVDTEEPGVSISNIRNFTANKDEVYGFTITATDTNLDEAGFLPVLTAMVRNPDGTFSEKTISLGEPAAVEAGKTCVYTVENLEEDAIYTLTCSVKDMAEHTKTLVSLEDGNEYESVRFSINRNGSVFGLDEATMKLVEDYYVQSVSEDVVIMEVNTDNLSEYQVTLNGETLVKEEHYTLTEEGGNGQWKRYTYSVNKDLFEEEGEYTVVISSKDAAENTAFSDVKNATVNFVVDKTAPIVAVSGLASNASYQTDVQTVTLIPTDDGGKLNSLLVGTVDNDGNRIEELVNLSGDALLESLETNNGMITFEIKEGLFQNIQIICNDCAVDAEGNTNTYDEVFKQVSVTTSAFMIFWANKVLRYGVIGGSIAAVGSGMVFVLFRRRKKSADKKK
uniref:hypothetical protein n=1 Tax=Agathobacter sp. TaxID=2021311 RepID=UPI00405752A6